jgi:hypothetical protein
MIIVIYWVIESDGKGYPSSVLECLLSHFLKRILFDFMTEAKIILAGPTLDLAYQVLLFLFEVVQYANELLRTSLELQ